jgi:O-antigen ligase
LLVVWLAVLGLSFIAGFAIFNVPANPASAFLLTLGLVSVAGAALVAFSPDVRAYLQARAASRSRPSDRLLNGRGDR